MTDVELLPCPECGMPCRAGEYHPFAACLMFKACHNSETVRANLAEIEKLRADAERYRWLKKSAFCNVWARGDGLALVAPRTPVADVDSKIDAAMEQEKRR